MECYYNALPEQVDSSHFPARVEGMLEEPPYTAVQSAVVGSVMQVFTAVRSASSWTRALNIKILPRQCGQLDFKLRSFDLD